MRRLAPFAAFLAACAHVDHDPTWADRHAAFAAPAAAATPEFARGIDAPAPADRVETGDHVVYLVTYAKGDERCRWRVRVEVLDARHRPVVWRDGTTHCSLRLQVTVHDDRGTEQGRDVVTVERDDLLFGMFVACEPGPDTPSPPPYAGWTAGMRAHLALANLMQVLRQSPALFGVLRRVIDLPSLFSILTNLGVTASVRIPFEKRIRLDPVEIEGRRYPVYEVPVELLLNRQPALRSKVLVTEPLSPLNLSAGILAMDAFQPSDPTAQVTIRVLAARRQP